MFARILREMENFQFVFQISVHLTKLSPSRCYFHTVCTKRSQENRLRVIPDPLVFLTLVLSELYCDFFQMMGV